MQQRNVVLFIVLSLLILIVGMYLPRWMGWVPERRPPVAKDETPPGTPGEDWPWRRLSADRQGLVVTSLLAAPAPGLPGVSNLLQLTAGAGVADDSKWQVALRQKPKEPVVEVKPPPKQERAPHREYTLGDTSFNITAVVTSKGAGVRKLYLTKFQGANRLGRPEWEADGTTPRQLELLQDSEDENLPPEERIPSFCLYLYSNPKKAEPLPTLGPLPELGEREWFVAEHDLRRVSFYTEVSEQGLRITKTYTLEPGDYHVGLELKFENQRPQEHTFVYQQEGPHRLPIEGVWYTNTFRNALIGWEARPKGTFYRQFEEARQISFQAGGNPVERGEDKRIIYAGIGVQYFASMLVVDNDQQDRDFLERARATVESSDSYEGKLVLLEGNTLIRRTRDGRSTQTYTLVKGAKVTIDGKKATLADLLPGMRIRVTTEKMNRTLANQIDALVEDKEFPELKPTQPFLDDITVRVISTPITLKEKGKDGSSVVHKYLLYNGPIKVRLLGQFRGNRAVDPNLVTRYEDTLHLNTLTDYHSSGFFGTFASKIYWTDLLIFCTNFMHGLLDFLHRYIMPWSYGLCIILLTVLVRGSMFPISRKAALASIRMQELAPELKKLKEKHKDDQQEFARAQMELFRKHGVNPFGSCLPLFLQMPIFLGLYYALQESIFFRLEPLPILGSYWIQNLAAPDMLVWWGENLFFSDPANQGSGGIFAAVFYLGPFFNLLPVLACILMIVQQSVMTPPPADEQQAMQQKMMKYMVIVFGLMFYKVAAGLCIYFIASSLWGLAERKLLPKRKPTPALAAPAGPGRGGAGGQPARSRPRPPRGEPDGRFQKVKDWWQRILKEAEKK
jgi:YidC/Oxa1 family membrane protein insertase